jgi:hypothetical protein
MRDVPTPAGTIGIGQRRFYLITGGSNKDLLNAFTGTVNSTMTAADVTWLLAQAGIQDIDATQKPMQKIIALMYSAV